MGTIELDFIQVMYNLVGVHTGEVQYLEYR